MRMSWFEKLLVNNPFFDFWRRQSAKKLLRHVRETSGRVLELGCGKGTTTIQIAKMLPNAKIIATDFDEGQVALAKEHASKRIKVTQADASKLKFKSNTFSAVFAFLTYHHVEDWRKALKESFRVLKPNGDLYVEELSLKPFPLLKHSCMHSPAVFSKAEFLSELKKSGFKLINSEGSYRFWVHARK